MPHRNIEVVQMTPATPTLDTLTLCVVEDVVAVTVIEECQIVSSLDLGSCTVTLVAKPGEGGSKKLIIQTSSGHSAVIPADIFGVLS